MRRVFSKTLGAKSRPLDPPHAPKEVTAPPQGIHNTPSNRPPHLPTNFSFTGHESKRREENPQLQIALNDDKAQRKHSTCSLWLLPSCRRCATAFSSIPMVFGHTRCMVKSTRSLVPSWWTLGGHPLHIHQNTYPPIDLLNAPSFETNVSRWRTHPQSLSRLALYGVPLQDIPALINAFTSAVKAKELSSPELEEYYTLS